MFGLKVIFTSEQKNFWNTFKNFFFGKFVGKDKLGNKYYKNKKDDRWVIYSKDVEATRITSDWFLWIHHTINEVPKEEAAKFHWQKDHSQNKTGTKDAYRPNKISKKTILRTMIRGSNKLFSFNFIYFIFF